MPYAPVLMLLGTADEEVSPVLYERLAARSRGVGGPIEIVAYEGAQHDFDDPGQTRQRVEANRRAGEDAMVRAERFFALHLRP